MKTINLEIFTENEDFHNDLDWFMCKYSKEYEIIKKRILSLNQIFDTEKSRDLKIDYFLGSDLEGRYHFGNLIGELYQSREIDVVSLSRATHIVKSINIDNLKYSAEVTIMDTNSGSPLQSIPEEILILRPVYHPHPNKYQIVTFNIDYNRSEIHKRILSRAA
jgi:hypothetical protein